MSDFWNGFQNTQNYLECQLVTALNAYHYLTGDSVEIGSEGYEELVDLSGGRSMPCLCMSPVYERLGIRIKKTYGDPIEFPESIPFPMEKVIYGASHSVLVVDWDRKLKKVRVTNFSQTDKEGWVSEEIFFWSTRIRDINYGNYKLFELDKKQGYGKIK